MAEGKWIEGLDAETPLADAARHVLTVRLDTVRHYLPLAVHHADEDIEHVHQLRVGTRRAAAALDLFAVCLPDKTFRKTRKHLRSLRRAAGEARDWDVFLAGLPTEADARQRPGLDFLAGYAFAQRRVAQVHLEAVGADEPAAFDRLLASTLTAIAEPHHGEAGTLGEWAQPWLSGLLKELDEAVAGNLEDYASLHGVRIIGKRLRYAMEVFAPCFAPAFRTELYPQVEAMQEILGNANDSHVTVERLTDLRAHLQAARPDDWKRLRAGVERLLRAHRQRLPRERQRFLRWWRQWQDSGGESALAQLLQATPVQPRGAVSA